MLVIHVDHNRFGPCICPQDKANALYLHSRDNTTGYTRSSLGPKTFGMLRGGSWDGLDRVAPQMSASQMDYHRYFATWLTLDLLGFLPAERHC